LPKTGPGSTVKAILACFMPTNKANKNAILTNRLQKALVIFIDHTILILAVLMIFSNSVS